MTNDDVLPYLDTAKRDPTPNLQAQCSLPENGVSHAVIDGYESLRTNWSSDFTSRGAIEYTRPPRGPPVVILFEGVPWVPVFGRHYALTGRHAQVNGSFVDSWLLNRKAEPYSDADHKDIHFWLRMLMPTMQIMTIITSPAITNRWAVVNDLTDPVSTASPATPAIKQSLSPAPLTTVPAFMQSTARPRSISPLESYEEYRARTTLKPKNENEVLVVDFERAQAPYEQAKEDYKAARNRVFEMFDRVSLAERIEWRKRTGL
ncbi:hypothetical protein N7488_011666 [Penicillium malachiteum]|nr:hypothetical protein N7488_011666 [Penicillium malachiteum]